MLTYQLLVIHVVMSGGQPVSTDSLVLNFPDVYLADQAYYRLNETEYHGLYVRKVCRLY